MIVVLLLILSFSSVSFINCSSLLFFLVLPVWVICTLAETHRAPFDFSESESELVSGFNTEYSGAFFAFIFLSEYSVLLFSCVLIVYVFFMSVIPVVSVILVVALALFISFIFIWIRVTYCRFRYDLLMSTAWKLLLPVALSLLTLLAPTLLV
jgi:NADH-ubiquinone oxidoreductase chain 1